MREARYVSLIPRTTLHSDSEQYLCMRTVCTDTTPLNYVHEYLFICSAMAIRDKLILSKMRKFSPSLIVEGPNVECSSVFQELWSFYFGSYYIGNFCDGSFYIGSFFSGSFYVASCSMLGHIHVQTFLHWVSLRWFSLYWALLRTILFYGRSF
jgi:hypothetical protein